MLDARRALVRSLTFSPTLVHCASFFFVFVVRNAPVILCARNIQTRLPWVHLHGRIAKVICIQMTRYAVAADIFCSALDAHSLWILDRETVNRKYEKTETKQNTIDDTNRNDTRGKGKKQRPNLHGMFISPFPP